ncbi:hypothetical protein [Nitrobacter hamburgensis]|uniref:hypothetical protein n=1 Tax=Nitrobacter hamburgensis TaxID=912 RepID=UPI001FDA5082|nr:hypothetical protein [Nitrobacter hamburgensis]
MLRVAPPIDTPFLSFGHDIGKPRLRAPRNVDRRACTMNKVAGAIPDANDELVLVLRVQQRIGVAAFPRGDIDRYLLKLRIEKLVHLEGYKEERHC